MLSPILLVFLFSCAPVAMAQRYKNVTLGSSLIAKSENSTWASPSGEFAFGFQQIIRGGYLLAIWFNKIPEKTIVWSANRNNLVQEGSKVELFADGRFELSDPRGQRIWYANQSHAGVAYGAMLDTGNFVLTTHNGSDFSWQSFNFPTDTLLPTQTLNQNASLVSTFSRTNYSSGRFQFILQNGSLVLYSRNFPLDDNIFAYWSIETIGSEFQVIFKPSGKISLITENGTVLDHVFQDQALTGLYYQRLVLEYDGVLKHYVYQKSANSLVGRVMGWSIMNFIPQNICKSFRNNTIDGACGYNSFCTLRTDDQMPNCECPKGYSPIDPNNSMSGCKPDFTPQKCDEEGRETENFILIERPSARWRYFDYESHFDVTEDWCRQNCVDDCFCAAVNFETELRQCWKKKYPLSNGLVEPGALVKALTKIRRNDTTWRSSSFSKRSNQSILIIIGSSLLGTSIFVNLVLCFINQQKSTTVKSYQVLLGLNMRQFSFEELQEATNEFREELGRGACSIVYKGILKNNNTETVVAVKKLHNMATEVEQEFKAEVSSISRSNHKNLVQLLGYCEESQNRLLVYEYMSNGSVADFLFVSCRLNWYKRRQIAFATARGICYLHEECNNQVIHCDIKPQNVLLDESFTAKISDFGLAKLLKIDQSRTTTGIRGTKGYIAPEWFRNVPITAKVDVYSFGVLLLELICCRRNYEPDIEVENEMILADFAYDCYKEGTVHLLVENDEEALNDKQLEKFVMIAIWCIQENPDLRPSMKRVIQQMEGSVEVPIPPDPSFITYA